MASDTNKNAPDRNPDLITGAPGSHPDGTAIGGVSGALAGAALGAIGGPVGAIIGGIAGAVTGGVGGHAAGEWNDPTEDEAYWRQSYTDRPYVKKGDSYDTYSDAYKLGTTHAREFNSSSTATAAPVAFETREAEFRSAYEKTPGASKLSFDNAKHAIKDAYDRTLQLREERLQIGKERVQTGEASIRKEVTTEHHSVDVPLQREELVIERRAASGTAAAGTIGDGETIRIPLSEERATVSKNTVVTEEVSIGKKTLTDTKTVGGDVRKETLKVDQGVTGSTIKTDVKK